MNLRSFGVALVFAAGVFMVAPSSFAQAPAKVQRIGILLPNLTGNSWREYPLWKELFASLAGLGQVEGQNFVVESRSPEGGRPERLPAAAAELVATRPDVMIAPVCGAPLNALRGATRTIPIVVATCTDDMVAAGIVASLARPGGNVTGLQKLTPELSAKRLELLKQLVPGAARIAVLWNPGYSDLAADWQALRSAAQAMKVTLMPFEAQSAAEYAPAFAAMTVQRVDAVFTFTDALGYVNAQRLADLAAKHRLPAIYPFRETALAGGLIAYGPNLSDMFRRSAGYVDKILRGAKAAELPIEQPTKFDFVINLKTARALGLTIPQSLLLSTDEVIE
ncbi:MAG TPA: ABC transporter substrate-binding protein [Burkholderiaceae bacterium]|nr:ABC transporter substrate-binding protein [Burkholderiaceae bacterium]